MKWTQKKEWLQQCQKELLGYLQNPDHLLSMKKQVEICKEVYRLEKRIGYLQQLPAYIRDNAFDLEGIAVQSGMNRNRQGVELKKLRALPKIERTWTTLQ